MKELDASWKGWLQENLDRKSSPEELLEILLKHGFGFPHVRKAMGEYFPQHSPIVAAYGESVVPIDYEGFYNIRLTRSTATGLQRFPNDSLQLYTFKNFMSPRECDVIAGLIYKKLRPSTITVESPKDKYYRTSSTCDMMLLGQKSVDELDTKIAETIGIYPSYSEGIQGQHYAVAQEFKEHTDYFDPGTSEYIRFASKQGNRTWTFMVYLDEPTEGGGTRFVKLDHVFQPQKGMAVIWNNLNKDGSPNENTLHAGLPVTKGQKTIITKWFRERGTGPIFYPN